MSNSPSYFDDVMAPPEDSGDFDPPTLYDQIYPGWRTGPVLPVNPLTDPMPTDPSLGSMSPEATTFPTSFADITGMGGFMPSLADDGTDTYEDFPDAPDFYKLRGLAGYHAGQHGAVPFASLNAPVVGDAVPDATGNAPAAPPGNPQTPAPTVQPSWSPDQLDQGLLDGLKNDPLPSLGGYGTDDPAPVEAPSTGQVTGQGGIAVKAPDPQTFAPVMQGLLDSVANAPLPSLANTIQRKRPEGKYGVVDVDRFKTDPTFDPDFADKLSGAIAEMNSMGIKPEITKGFRTAAEQKWQLDHPGSSGRPVAKVSWHQAGQAVDMNTMNRKDYPVIDQVMRKHGFVSGERFGDPGHYQSARPGTSPDRDTLSLYGGD